MNYYEWRYQNVELSLYDVVICLFDPVESAGLNAGRDVLLDQAGQLSGWLIEVLGWVLGVNWVFVEGLVVVVGLEGKQLMAWVMLWRLLSNDWNVHRNDVLNAIVFLEDFCLLKVLYAGLYFLQFDWQGFLLLSELIDFACKTNCFSVELDHDGSSDSIIDFSEVVGVDDLLDEVISFSHCDLDKNFVVLFAADRNIDCLWDVV